MGLSDREYYRDDEPGGYHVGGERLMVTNLVIVNVAVYLVCMFMEDLTRTLSLQPDLFASLWNLTSAWQLVTYGFVHSPIGAPGAGIFHILINMYVLWMFGREVEMKYGRFEFLRLYLVAIVFSGLVWVFAKMLTGYAENTFVLGASGAVTAVVILFCFNWPKRTIFLFGLMSMPAWVLGAILVGLDMLRGFDPKTNVAWECHLAGAIFGLAYFKLGLNFAQFTPAMGKPRWFRRRPALKVHQPDEHYQSLDEEADRVLDKLHRVGEDGLTPHERKVLEDYSRRMRQKHR